MSRRATTRRKAPSVGVALVVALLVACGGARRRQDDDLGEPSEGLVKSWRFGFERLDVLLVVDEQRSLAASPEEVADRAATLVDALVRVPPWPEVPLVPQEDLHLVVVDGEDVTRHTHLHRLDDDGCEPTVVPVVEATRRILSSPSDRPLERGLLGTIEATLRGTLVSGFPREDSAVLVLVVTGRDDRSTGPDGRLRSIDDIVLTTNDFRDRRPAPVFMGLVAPTRPDLPPRLWSYLTTFATDGVVWPLDDETWLPVLQMLSVILPGLTYQPPEAMPTLDEPGPCRLVESLPDGSPCPQNLATTEGRICGPGWHRDLGVDPWGRRRCEILPSDRDGDGLPDLRQGALPETCCLEHCPGWRDTSGCVPGWFESPIRPPGDGPTILFTWGSPEVGMSPRATLRMECDTEP